MVARVPVFAVEGASESTPVLAGETLAGDMPLLTPDIPLPAAWPEHARSAVLFAVALAHHGPAVARALSSASSPHGRAGLATPALWCYVQGMRQTLDPRLDIVFKLLFAHPKRKHLLLSLLRAVLRVPIQDATVLNPEVTKEAVRDKGIVLDIAVRLGDGRMVDVEMQADSRPGFRRRALYYWARLFGSQLTPGQLYTSLKPVISVVFLNYRELTGDMLHSVFELRERKTGEVFSDALQFHAIELPNLRILGAEELLAEPELVRWARFLAADTDEDRKALAEEDVVMKQATAELELLSADTEARELASQRELALLTYQFEINAAREEGEAKGEAKGEARGKAEGMRQAARKLRATGMAREQIAALLELKLEEVPDDEA